MEMRQAFAKELENIMDQDDRVCIIDADLAKATGTSGLHKKYPDRALNVGVAEANMASVAAGLSSYGFIPFITTFTPFASRRCFDQVAISIAYAKQNVKIVGTDPGIAAELNGGTHMSFEDVALMRAVPTMVVFEPVDEIQIRQALPQIVAHYGPVYIRLFRKESPAIFGDDYVFDLFKADVITEGTDITILATGIMLRKAIDAAIKLSEAGISAEVINVHTLKPLDKDTILKSVKKTGRVVTAENHNVIGGLYSAVSELLAAEYPVRIERVGVEDTFGEVGRLNELAERFELTEEAIVAKSKLLVANLVAK
jgi:transketolase